ncbi:Phosphate-binding protein pstS precursor [uncultured Roseburia sp.]|uniref:Extracellular solute-binding protein n=1 Tax=Brotonthovivens ammoniilytica TaxID=2981725 RepID=A0ABT2TMQ1_9FIRM|nr:substrate-binding domain-containing protein [Brotonthovivens ammoniilytica]MCU6763504.1 extracellular solute-binding protein [Brotonthovivens ammoniilytica]SCJ21688.1 Phosphate-binding protein pstS precursor [uncultured Roseburia sp.]
MKKKKVLTLGLAAALSAVTVLAGCGSKDDAGKDNTSASQEAKAPSGEITVVSREDGSGTRGAFIELFGIEEKDAEGNKIDNTTAAAEITNSTAVMMTTVAGNENAIGYVSLGSLNESVKALNVDGVAPSAEGVKDGTYKIARPFNVVTKDGISEVAQDFLNYIMSDEGQQVVEENGYVSQGSNGSYKASGLSGDISVAGSSSVTPVMEKLKEAYEALNPNVNIEVQESDSTTGVTSATEGVCDLGMASRELKDSETAAGAKATVIAMDGIAVVVNNNNTTAGLTSDQIKSIFTGETTDWSSLAE